MNQDLQRLLEAYGAWQESPPDHPESRSRFEALLDAIMEERPRVRRPELLAAIHRRWLAQLAAERRIPTSLPPKA